MTTEEMLKGLLAVIHRDGGHYTEEHGLLKSVADAMSVVSGLRVENDQAREGFAEVHRALKTLEASIRAQTLSSPATDRPALRADAPVAPLPRTVQRPFPEGDDR